MKANGNWLVCECGYMEQVTERPTYEELILENNRLRGLILELEKDIEYYKKMFADTARE